MKIINFILLIISISCLYIIFSVGLRILPCLFESSNAQNINVVFINLSYSYIAGLIFYFFVSFFPILLVKQKIKPVIDFKIINLKTQITSFIRSFNSIENINIDEIDINFIRELISKHSILDKSFYSAMTNTNMSNLTFLDSSKLNIFKLIETILTYKEYLKTNEILELEKIRDSKFFHLTKMANYPIDGNFYNSKTFKEEFIKSFFEIIESVRKI